MIIVSALVFFLVFLQIFGCWFWGVDLTVLKPGLGQDLDNMIIYQGILKKVLTNILPNAKWKVPESRDLNQITI